MKNYVPAERRIGAFRGDDIKDYAPFLRDGIEVYIFDNKDGHIDCGLRAPQLLVCGVNDYKPGKGEAFDGEQWADRQGYIYAAATRLDWICCYRIARALLRYSSPVTVSSDSKQEIVEMPCLITVKRTVAQ